MGAHARTPTAPVTRGLALTGRVITAAAAIMVTVFASFMLGEERIIKLFGLGLASAVLIDAVIIRSVLVPAIMQLLRQARLVVPEWLAAILPSLAVEPAEGDPAPTESEQSSARRRARPSQRRPMPSPTTPPAGVDRGRVSVAVLRRRGQPRKDAGK